MDVWNMVHWGLSAGSVPTLPESGDGQGAVYLYLPGSLPIHWGFSQWMRGLVPLAFGSGEWVLTVICAYVTNDSHFESIGEVPERAPIGSLF